MHSFKWIIQSSAQKTRKFIQSVMSTYGGK